MGTLRSFLLGIVLALTATPRADAILPLPYPDEPWDESGFVATPERDPRSIQAFSELYSSSHLREMELPLFENPSNTLGFIKGYTFIVPPELKARVNFWRRVYTEFHSSQALLHDTNNLDIIYGVVDFSHIDRLRLSPRAKRRRINRFLRDEKKKIVRILLTLDSYRDRPLEIPVELVPIFKQFAGVPGKDRFLRAIPFIRAQIGQRDRIVQGFLYGGRYFAEMMDIFQSYQIPRELTRLTLVESGFDIRARSKVGASGVWQFMRSTGKKYLRIDRSVDERNDPILATHAAAKLLRKNYEHLGNWPLAVTAYNHGRAGMARAIRELSTTDLATIIARYDSSTFGFASSNFYASFLAMLEIERDYRKYFGKLLVDSPVDVAILTLPKDAPFGELALACGMPEKELAQFNPALTRYVTSGRANVPSDYRLRVPAGSADRCRSGFQNI